MPKISTKTKTTKTPAAGKSAVKPAVKAAVKKAAPAVKTAAAKVHAPAKKEHKEPVIINKGESCRAVGRRKCAAARVRISRGSGNITVNGRDFKKYFSHFSLQEAVLAPLKAVGKDKDLDVSIKVVGGGIKGQADAVKHGIARALVKWNEDFRKSFKTIGMLTRDARVKERKKFGLKRARRAPQWSKR
jgi:small subunit ribosomal protein S9